MTTLSRLTALATALAAVLGVAGSAIARLPPPTPEEAQAAAMKKQQAAAQAEKEKKDLAAAMERLATRWRARAADEGWEVPPQVAVPPPAPAPAPGAAPAAAPSATHGAPPMPVRSEKTGTAPPSEDVKDPAKKGK